MDDAESQFERRVVAAAIKLKDGRVICGVRHFDQIMLQWLLPNGQEAISDADRKMIEGHEQGFVDNAYKYIDRQEAYTVAKAAGQVMESQAHQPGTLFSEDVW